MFKKSVIAAVVSASTVGAVVAAEQKLVFRMQANGTVSVPEWVVISHNYTTWVNSGGEHSCQEWLVPTNQVDWGQNFQQSRSCLQTQERQATPILLNPILGTQKEGDTFTETRNITTSQFQPAIGTRDYITGETSGPWGAWGNTGSPYSCDVWAPEPDTVNLFDPFTQTRDCQQDQVREQQVFHTWASGAQTPKRIDSGNQTITVTESRSNQGTRDYITGERLGAWTPWVNVGGHYDCGTWSPAPGSQMANFTQTRDCSQNQTGSRDVFNVFRSGAETFNRTEPRNQTITEVESRSVTATAGSWSNTTVQNCGTWGPAPTTQTSSFTQTRTCDQNQERTWTYTSGGNIGTYTEQRTVEGSAIESRTVTVSWTDWSNSGAPKNHSAYTPAASNQTANFVQTRNYEQPQTRSRNYSTGDTFTETRDLASVENRNVTVAVNAWTNTTVQNCSATWTPAPGAQMANFTQTRVCDQNQTRTWTYVADGSTIHTLAENQTVAGAGSESRTVTATAGTWANVGAQSCTAWGPAAASQTANFTQTRTCTQARERVWTYTVGGTTIGTHTETGSVAGAGPTSRTVTVTAGAWSNTTVQNCAATWSPAPSTQTSNFTQTRSCDQNQTRTWTYVADGSTIHTRTENQTVAGAGSESRTVTVTAGSWSNVGAQSCTAWSPAASSQTSSFTQTRTCTQAQERTWTYTAGGSTIHTRGESGSVAGAGPTSQTVTVSWTAWSNSGSPYSCTAWSPSTGAVNFGQSFTQSRDCSQNQTRTRNYSDGSSFGESQTITITQTQSATGTYQNWVSTSPSCGGWSYGGYSYGSWSPAPSTQTSSFTQTRSYSRPMSRSCQPREYDTVTGSFRNVGSAYTENSTDSGTESRTVTVSWSGWANSGGTYNCTAWSPDPSTVNQGVVFTQTQTCSQNQTRSRNYSDGSSFTESQTILVYPTRSSTGTKSTVDCSGRYSYDRTNDYGFERVETRYEFVGGGVRTCSWNSNMSRESCMGPSMPSNQYIGAQTYYAYEDYGTGGWEYEERQICRN